MLSPIFVLLITVFLLCFFPVLLFASTFCSFHFWRFWKWKETNGISACPQKRALHLLSVCYVYGIFWSERKLTDIPCSCQKKALCVLPIVILSFHHNSLNVRPNLWECIHYHSAEPYHLGKFLFLYWAFWDTFPAVY